jgi:hypothetical protein
MGRPAVYGQANAVKAVVQIPAAASVSLAANGGRFVCLVSNRATLASGSNTGGMFGWTEACNFTTSSTAGNDVLAVNIAKDAIYEIPINATQTETELKALIGETCDLEVVSGIQYANYDASSDDTIQIVGYKYYGTGSGNQSLLVRLYARNESASSVA